VQPGRCSVADTVPARSPQRVKALRAAALEDAKKMAGLTDAVRSFVAEAWNSAAKEKQQLQCQAAAAAAADSAKYKVRA
jgi:hypothetical protein